MAPRVPYLAAMIQAATEPVRPVRPAAVTVAFWLQLVAAALLLLLIGLVVWQAVDWDGQIDRAARLVPDADPDEVRGERVTNVVMSSVLGVTALLLAVGLAVTAPYVRRGANSARILVFVAAGLPLLIFLVVGCPGALLLPLAFAPGPEGEPPSDAGAAVPWEESKFAETLYSTPDPVGDAFAIVGVAGTLAVVLLSVAVVLLLALPPASRYFVPRVAPAGAYPIAMGASGMPLVPPGYMICPDPTLHFAHRPPGAEPSPSQIPPPQTPL